MLNISKMTTIEEEEAEGDLKNLYEKEYNGTKLTSRWSCHQSNRHYHDVSSLGGILYTLSHSHSFSCSGTQQTRNASKRATACVQCTLAAREESVCNLSENKVCDKCQIGFETFCSAHLFSGCLILPVTLFITIDFVDA